MSVPIIFFNLKRLASSKAIEEVPTPEAPPIKIMRGFFEFLSDLQFLYLTAISGSMPFK